MTLTKTPICDFGKKADFFELKSIENKLISLNDIKGFEKIVQDYRIVCQVESFGEYVIFTNFEGSPNLLQAIKKLPVGPY